MPHERPDLVSLSEVHAPPKGAIPLPNSAFRAYDTRMNFMSRREVGDAHGVPEGTLRADERDGLLPQFGTCPLEEYRARVDLVKAARRGGLSPRRIRAGLEIPAPHD